MAEWSKATVLKTVDRYAVRGFESLSLRHVFSGLRYDFRDVLPSIQKKTRRFLILPVNQTRIAIGKVGREA